MLDTLSNYTDPSAVVQRANDRVDEVRSAPSEASERSESRPLFLAGAGLLAGGLYGVLRRRPYGPIAAIVGGALIVLARRQRREPPADARRSAASQPAEQRGDVVDLSQRDEMDRANTRAVEADEADAVADEADATTEEADTVADDADTGGAPTGVQESTASNDAGTADEETTLLSSEVGESTRSPTPEGADVTSAMTPDLEDETGRTREVSDVERDPRQTDTELADHHAGEESMANDRVADEAGEATGPDPVQAQPTRTEATEPEPEPDEDHDGRASEAAGDERSDDSAGDDDADATTDGDHSESTAEDDRFGQDETDVEPDDASFDDAGSDERADESDGDEEA